MGSLVKIKPFIYHLHVRVHTHTHADICVCARARACVCARPRMHARTWAEEGGTDNALY